MKRNGPFSTSFLAKLKIVGDNWWVEQVSQHYLVLAWSALLIIGGGVVASVPAWAAAVFSWSPFASILSAIPGPQLAAFWVCIGIAVVAPLLVYGLGRFAISKIQTLGYETVEAVESEHLAATDFIQGTPIPGIKTPAGILVEAVSDDPVPPFASTQPDVPPRGGCWDSFLSKF